MQEGGGDDSGVARGGVSAVHADVAVPEVSAAYQTPSTALPIPAIIEMKGGHLNTQHLRRLPTAQENRKGWREMKGK